MGPHGLCVGATGSGQVGAAADPGAGARGHPLHRVTELRPRRLQGRRHLRRHVGAAARRRASPTGPDDRLHRWRLTGELQRRQELLRAAGDFARVEEYERVRAGGAALEPLPSLVLVIDEFGELLTARPELTDIFLADRPRRRIAGRPSAAGVPAPARGRGTRPRHPSVVPRRPPDIVTRRLARHDRRPRRLPPPPGPRLRLPALRYVHPGTLPGAPGVRRIPRRGHPAAGPLPGTLHRGTRPHAVSGEAGPGTKPALCRGEPAGRDRAATGRPGSAGPPGLRGLSGGSGVRPEKGRGELRDQAQRADGRTTAATRTASARASGIAGRARRSPRPTGPHPTALNCRRL